MCGKICGQILGDSKKILPLRLGGFGLGSRVFTCFHKVRAGRPGVSFLSRFATLHSDIERLWQIERSIDDDAVVFVGTLEVVGNATVEDDFAAFVAFGGGVHEPDAVPLFHRDADMRGVGAGVFAGDREDVPRAQVALDGGNAVFWDMIHGQGGDFLLDAGHAGEERGVAAEVSVAFPHGRHFADLTGKPFAAEFLCGIHGEAARAVVGEDFLEKMHARQVAAITTAVAVALEFDEG